METKKTFSEMIQEGKDRVKKLESESVEFGKKLEEEHKNFIEGRCYSNKK